MHVPRVLIIYGTSYGQTEKIARVIGGELQHHAFNVTLFDANRLPRNIRPDAYDGVVIGASIIMQGHQPVVQRFVRDHVATLNRMPAAFFSVCASAGSIHEKHRDAARRLCDVFLATVGWKPAVSASIAGAINFTRYSVFLRWYMKLASRLNGGSTDTSRDHEYTDWVQVDEFADKFAAVISDTPAARLTGVSV